jgi:hypothetical protein
MSSLDFPGHLPNPLAIDVPAFAKWMLTLAFSIFVVGAASMGTINLVSQQVYRTVPVEPRVAPAQMRSVQPIAVIAPAAAAEPVSQDASEAQTAQSPSAPAAPAKATPAAPATVPEKPKMMATLSLAVRSHPDKYSAQIGGLEQGEITTISGKQKGWMLVTTKSGVSGWAYGGYLKPVDPHIASDSPFWNGKAE